MHGRTYLMISPSSHILVINLTKLIYYIVDKTIYFSKAFLNAGYDGELQTCWKSYYSKYRWIMWKGLNLNIRWQSISYCETMCRINSIVVTELHINELCDLPINVCILDLKICGCEDDDFGIIKNIWRFHHGLICYTS